MKNLEKFTLDNGLRVIVHKDKTTSVVAVNLLYDVGAKDESPERTGFAHLFEHLMFGGSVNIPFFDKALQKAGGTDNAFTNNDYTNYYISIPKNNIETAFWLESDRMMQLNFTKKSLEVQRNVVIEEFKQMYLNQPYGDVWLLMRPLAYKVHPYRWATIGKNISHIEKATMQDVKDFYYNHYAPNNAILTVAGDVDIDNIKKMTEKWFGTIERRNIIKRNLPIEPKQTEARTMTVKRNVPANAIYKTFHICSRRDRDFHTTDLISDILSAGESSRLIQNLIKRKNIFTSINAYLSGSIENGLFVFSGKLSDGISFEEAEYEINREINLMTTENVSDYELQKVKNKIESKIIFAETNILEKAMSLSFFELLSSTENINDEVNKYIKVSADDIRETASKIFRPENCSTLYYAKSAE